MIRKLVIFIINLQNSDQNLSDEKLTTLLCSHACAVLRRASVIYDSNTLATCFATLSPPQNSIWRQQKHYWWPMGVSKPYPFQKNFHYIVQAKLYKAIKYYFTGYSFWEWLRNFLLTFTWVVLSVHKLNKLGKFMDNCWISCQVMADMKKVYNDLIITNLYCIWSRWDKNGVMLPPFAWLGRFESLGLF